MKYIKATIYCAIAVFLLMPGLYMSSISPTIFDYVSFSGLITGLAFVGGIFFTFAFIEMIEEDKKHRRK